LNFFTSMSRILSVGLIAMFCVMLSLSGLRAQRGATILDHKDRIRVSRVGILNSSARETNLSITPDGNYLYYMSLRGGKSWSRSYMTFRGDSVYDGDIWYAQRVGNRWQNPRCMPYGINTSQGEDEPNISANGKRVYFQSWNIMWDRTGGPYYMAERNGNKWSSPRGLGGGITEFFHHLPATDGMSISVNEKTFVVAAGPDYDAPMDIFLSRQSRYGWTYCKRLPISTPGDDRSVFLAADGKTLYFASDGYKGFGGLDIYKTTLINDSTFGEVVNVGAPFNTPADDYGLILTGDGNEAYFIRDGDIYFADLKEADPLIKPEIPTFTQKIEGTIRDKDSWANLNADVILMDARSKRIIRKTKTSRGKYTLPLPNKDRVYDQIVIAEGYPRTRKRITVTATMYDNVIKSNLLLKRERELPVETPPVASTDPVKPAVIEPDPVDDPPVEDKGPGTTVPIIDKVDSNPTAGPGISENNLPTNTPAPVVEPQDPYDFNGVAENNLILLLDVSASMKKPEKLPLLKDAFDRLLDHMRPEDQISIIVYSGDARVILNGVSAARKITIQQAIKDLRSGGATKGKTALRKAYRLAEDNFIPGGNNRIIMATDGYFDVPPLYDIAERNAGDDIYLTVFSFGKLTEEQIAKLSELARKGGGNFANIKRENVDEALLSEAKAVQK
ncbi:MAG: VWA domain-containing protein, partial [Bacteroidota bacterium]